jgi:hypothetical protein
MGAKRETFYVTRADDGWIIRTNDQAQLGPYIDKDQAVLMAMTFARAARPSEVKVENTFGSWWTEHVFDDPNPRSPT